MDAHDIFKKLTRGTNLNLKKAIQVQHTKVLTTPVKNEPTSEESIQPSRIDRGKKKLSKMRLAALKQEEVNHLRNQERISVTGPNIPDPLRTFEDLKSVYGLSTVLVDNLLHSGYTSPTPIQSQAIPLMLQGRQLLACAPTGSGKTAAFLVPVFHHLGRPKHSGIRAVIVSPTRELARQTLRECQRLSEGTALRCHLVKKAPTVARSSNQYAVPKCDLLITTPNRLVYLLKQDPPAISLTSCLYSFSSSPSWAVRVDSARCRAATKKGVERGRARRATFSLYYDSVEWLVVDESDKLFESGAKGFRDQLATIYNACDSTTLKRAMFSATSTPDVARWARKNLTDLALVTVGHRNSAAEQVEQELLFVGSEAGKLVAFRNLVHQGLKPPVLVFVQSKERAKELFTELIYEGINVDVIHADRTQLQRDNVVRSFREGRIWVLICTELMGRGIDFKGVNLVVNYDFPSSAISYIHRIGTCFSAKTGRAGQPGKAITFFTQDDSVNLRSIAYLVQESGGNIPEYMLGLKRPSKRTRRQLESHALQRESISTTPSYQQDKERKQLAFRKKRRNHAPETYSRKIKKPSGQN
uniref:Probable ATP-dependent RNA helicase DDX52 n=1 Tax=Timema bartmani TaxID=61472 RepID=A0A7R9F2V8_9NEOP|nr:unnamed protein product [Timema bartmani]